MEHELLHAPGAVLARPDFVLRHARKSVYPCELAQPGSAGAKLTDKFSVQRELLHFSWTERRDVEVLRRPRRNAQALRPEGGRSALELRFARDLILRQPL